MLSRVAEAIYWMCRNVERAENIARFIEVAHDFALDMPGEEHGQWAPLIAVTGDAPVFQERHGLATEESVVNFLVLSEDYPNSIARLITVARENARSVRETIASEMWEQLNELYQWFRRETRGGQPWHAPSDFYRAIMRESALFGGITDATMTRDQGWHFANLGRQIERADQISRLLDVKYFTLLPNPGDVNTPVDDLQWSALLRSVSGLEMYRKLHHEVTVTEVVEFLVLNRRFPRAISHCLAEANRSLHAITGCPVGEFSNAAEQTLGRLCADLAFTDAKTIIGLGLHEYVDDLQRKLNAVGDGIFEAFFALRPISPSSQTQSQTLASGLTQSQSQTYA
ncbi:MAG: hypothetical protein CMJ31_05215 [Phycisphaerae bacterium]|nr:hypothetical protein [Phycisphaerae bacterium]